MSMPRDSAHADIRGLDASTVRIGVVASRYNDAISEALLAGALRCLREHGVPDSGVVVDHVPGAFELPLAAKWFCKKGMDAVICLGAVIRGETAHFEHVSREAASGIRNVGLRFGIPVMFGVLTTDTLAQALDRCRPDTTNKGYECAAAALEMLALAKRIHGE
jgi:6,7-dimethyl-8-ribityllumazine synthase